jgi:hypothetical protein
MSSNGNPVVSRADERGHLDRVSDNGFDPERRLWTAVLLQAVQDWQSVSARARREAETFLFESEADFESVCQHAGIDPGSLQTKLKRLPRASVAHIDFRRGWTA